MNIQITELLTNNIINIVNTIIALHFNSLIMFSFVDLLAVVSLLLNVVLVVYIIRSHINAYIVRSSPLVAVIPLDNEEPLRDSEPFYDSEPFRDSEPLRITTNCSPVTVTSITSPSSPSSPSRENSLMLSTVIIFGFVAFIDFIFRHFLPILGALCLIFEIVFIVVLFVAPMIYFTENDFSFVGFLETIKQVMYFYKDFAEYFVTSDTDEDGFDYVKCPKLSLIVISFTNTSVRSIDKILKYIKIGKNVNYAKCYVESWIPRFIRRK